MSERFVFPFFRSNFLMASEIFLEVALPVLKKLFEKEFRSTNRDLPKNFETWDFSNMATELLLYSLPKDPSSSLLYGDRIRVEPKKSSNGHTIVEVTPPYSYPECRAYVNGILYKFNKYEEEEEEEETIKGVVLECNYDKHIKGKKPEDMHIYFTSKHWRAIYDLKERRNTTFHGKNVSISDDGLKKIFESIENVYKILDLPLNDLEIMKIGNDFSYIFNYFCV